MVRILFSQTVVAFFFCFCLQQAAAPAKQNSDFLTITFQNTRYGAVDALLPNHQTPILIGRVLSLARNIQHMRIKMNANSIYGTTHSGFSIATGAHTGIQFALFCSPPARKPDTTVATDLHMNTDVMKQLLHQPEQAGLMQHNTLLAFPNGYQPAYGDIIAIQIPVTPKSSLPGMLQMYAKQYAAAAAERAKLWHLPIVNGLVTVNARLPDNEPDHIYAVAFLIDDATYDLRNIAPYQFRWNSRKAPDGEHTLEVDALDQAGSVITRQVTLVLVQNHLQQPSAQLH